MLYIEVFFVAKLKAKWHTTCVREDFGFQGLGLGVFITKLLTMLRVANKDTSLVSPINWYDFLDLICVKYVFKKCCPIVAAVARACWRTWQNKRKTLINAVNTIVVKLNHESNDQSSDERSKSHMTSVTMNSKGHKISDNSQGSMNGKQKRQHITTKKKKKKRERE